METPKRITKPRQVRKAYTKEFKEQIIKLCAAKKKETTVRDIIEEYGIPESVYYEWKRIYDKYGTLDRRVIREGNKTELEKLEERVKRLEMENDILKHVALMLGVKTPQDLESSSEN